MPDGWKILNRKVDYYDSEWNVFKSLIGNYWYWFLIHLISSEIFRSSKLKVWFNLLKKIMLNNIKSVLNLEPINSFLCDNILSMFEYVQHPIFGSIIDSNYNMLYFKYLFKEKKARLDVSISMACYFKFFKIWFIFRNGYECIKSKWEAM